MNNKNTMDPAKFLGQFSEELLVSNGILNTRRQLLNGDSVQPLADLMSTQGIQRLQRGRWFLDIK